MPNKSEKILQWFRLAVICGIFFIDIANLGMANIALPSIKEDLNFSEGSLQWVLTAYSLTYGALLMIGGRSGDLFAQYTILQVGMVIFNASTLACALVSNRIGLVIGRAFQGVGASLTVPSAQACVSLFFEDPKARVVAYAVWGATGSTGFVLGPIFGGLFTSSATWRWIFWFSLIAEGALQIASVFLLRKVAVITTGKKHRDESIFEILRNFDPLGISLSTPGLILLVYSITSGNQDGWNTGGVIAPLVISICLLGTFVFVELRVATHPLVPRYLWSDKLKWSGCAIAALTYAVWQGSNYLLTLELQEFGFSPLQTAIRFLPLGNTALVVNSVIPYLLKPVGTSNLFLISWVLAIAGVVLLAMMGSQQDYWRFCLPGMILYISGVGTAYYVGNILVVASAAVEQQGSVSGLTFSMQMCLNVGGAVLGVAMSTLVVDSVASQSGGTTARAQLNGYRAGYYLCLGFCGLATLLSLVLVAFHRRSSNNIGVTSPENHSKDEEKVAPQPDVSTASEQP